MKRQFWTALFAALIGLGGFAAQAQALEIWAPERSALMLDVKRNKVLFSDAADATRHPASLTKMMTLYLLFDALEKGELTLQSPVIASAHSDSQPPSDLRHNVGESIPVDLAIDALVVRSANDVAAAVGELLGGTEYNFADMMTAKARQLGMNDTFYRNASGLHHPEQVTTALDTAKLSLALKRDFPQFWNRFSVTQVSYKGKTWESHNNLVKDVASINGIKTGYIRASGFNVATYSAQPRGDRLVVMIGGHTAKRRDQAVLDILSGKRPAYQIEAEELARQWEILQSAWATRGVSPLTD